jgi:hypothetical protein
MDRAQHHYQVSLAKTSFRKLHDNIKFMIEQLDLFSSEDDLKFDSVKHLIQDCQSSITIKSYSAMKTFVSS